MNTKEKGDLLENIVADICGKILGAKITKQARFVGKRSGIEREIDVMIQGKVGAFDVMIAIESKHYKDPVGVEKVEAFKTKMEDVGANLGGYG